MNKKELSELKGKKEFLKVRKTEGTTITEGINQN
jgi:hypothetical protein